MDVKFRDIFAGCAGRPRKPKHHRIVDRLPATSRNSARVAIRGIGIFPARDVSTDQAWAPETRTMAIAVGGRPDESAKMV